MREKLQSLADRPFVRNVATVASGAAVSQIVTMAFTPFLTRLFGPEAYGLQGLFISVTGLLSIVAGLGYPMAIILPKNDLEAAALVKISILSGIMVSLIAALLLFFFGKDLLNMLNAESIYPFIAIIPVAMLVSVINNVLTQWIIRSRAYSLSARFAVFTTLLLNISKLSIGNFYPTVMVLIVINVIGSLLGSILTYVGWKKSTPQHCLASTSSDLSGKFWEIAARHGDFPMLRTPQNMINAISQSLPILLLASYFGASSAGQYSVAIAVLGMPANLIGGSVMSVFYPRINEAIHHGEEVRSLIIKATLGMAVTGILPYCAVILAGPSLFSIIFGQEWQKAGVYAQLLSIWIFFQYINKPAVSAIPALNLQKGLLVYELFSTGTKIFALWLGFEFFKSEIAAVALFSIFGVIAYIWLILWVIYQSGRIK